jgi:RHS repeat-associated protein
LQFIQTSKGRLVPDGSGGFNYEYAIKDHLGNTRVMFSQTGEVLQDQSYYPFGMGMGDALTFNNNTTTPENKYLYNGKELQDDFDLGWYDYGNRYYDPSVARWHTPDLMAEFYYDQSPYNYVANDPINYIDPNGDFRTKFGAWWYKLWHGGDGIAQDKGGEYFVYTDEVTTDDEGVNVTSIRVFDKNGRNKGKDLEYEAAKKRWVDQYEFQQSMEKMGVEVYYTDDINEARASMLQIPAMLVLPNVLKTTSAITATTKSGINSVDDLLKAAGNLKRVKGAKQGFVNGNAQKIFNRLVKGGTKVRGNLYQLKDGTLVNLHNSKRIGVQTIDINKAGQVYKIRVQ